jgi:hypothetical protein
MFTKAIVLSETEFRSLVVDFEEMMKEEFESKKRGVDHGNDAS